MPHPGSSVSSSAGLTRTELLVLLAVLFVLAAVGLGPLLRYLENWRIGHAVENARTISTLLSQYATDNDGVYPAGEGTTAVGKSEGIARNLLANNYTPDPTLFALPGAEKYSGKASDFADFSAANISWDFTTGATASTGILSTAPDTLPTVYTTGETLPYPIAPGVGLDLPLSGHGPFGKKGVVVAYKSNNAVFIPATDSGVCPGFISKKFQDTATYTQIKP
jgi:type II secretory pathway pseudopilin PulG